MRRTGRVHTRGYCAEPPSARQVGRPTTARSPRVCGIAVTGVGIEASKATAPKGRTVTGGIPTSATLYDRRLLQQNLSEASIARFNLARDELGDLQIVACSSRGEALYNAIAILCHAVLAHLPLTFKPRNGKVEAYDTSQHNLDV